MGIFSAISDVAESVNGIRESIADAKTAELVKQQYEALGSDSENPETRKQAGDIIVNLLNAQKFDTAVTHAEQLSTIFGKEFTYFYLPVAAFLDDLERCSRSVMAYDNNKKKKLAQSLVSANEKMNGFTVDKSILTSIAGAVKNFIEGREHRLLKGVRGNNGDTVKDYLKGDTAGDRVNKVINYIKEQSSSVFVYKCFAENLGSYREFGHFYVNPELKKTQYAIPGPAKSNPDTRFGFMRRLSSLQDGDALLSLINLINGYSSDKKNRVSVKSGEWGAPSCSAKINLNDKLGFLAKTCNITLKFSGKKNRQLIISGKVNVKNKPELLEKAKSFKYWKVLEEKPVLQIDIRLKNEEFVQKFEEIPEIAKAVDAENAEIKAVLTAK